MALFLCLLVVYDSYTLDGSLKCNYFVLLRSYSKIVNKMVKAVAVLGQTHADETVEESDADGTVTFSQEGNRNLTTN